MQQTEITDAFSAAVCKIPSTMAGLTPTVGKPFIKEDREAAGEFSAVIGVTGDYSGSICVTFGKTAAECVTRAMLGDCVENIQQDAIDTVGEISNMVSGQARALLAEKGIVLQGSTPTIITGEKHSINHLAKAPVTRIPFTTPDGSFAVEFCLE